NQDLNADGVIGTPPPTTPTDRGAGENTTLAVAGGTYYLLAHGTTSGPTLGYGGAAVVVGQMGAWTPLGAEKVGSTYEVVWKYGTANQYNIWNTDSSGMFTTGGPLSDPALQSLETTFNQDLNADGVIGTPAPT